MKKITVTHSNGTQLILIVKNEIDFNNGGLYYKRSDGVEGFFELSKTDKVSIEYHEERTWCIVLGLGSNRIYARMTERHIQDYEVMIIQDLTKEEAMAMAENARSALGMEEIR